MQYDDGTITIDLEARQAMFEELDEEFPHDLLEQELETTVFERLADLYNNRDQIREQLEAQQ